MSLADRKVSISLSDLAVLLGLTAYGIELDMREHYTDETPEHFKAGRDMSAEIFVTTMLELGLNEQEGHFLMDASDEVQRNTHIAVAAAQGLKRYEKKKA